MAQVERMVEGVDGIIHLGGISGENTWEKILEGNIVGLYNVFEAARRAGVKRIVMATSNHAVGFYPRADDRPPGRAAPRQPLRRLEGVLEALASLYADKHGIGFLCTRIGNFGVKPIDSRRLSIWISPRDYTQLVRIGLEHPDIRYEIVYGVSGNQRSWYDNSNAYRLGYRPQDDSEPHAAAILAAEAGQPKDPIAERYQGGTFCADGYDAAKPPNEMSVGASSLLLAMTTRSAVIASGAKQSRWFAACYLLNSLAPGGVGTSKTLRVTETNE